jgi:hypothetical protein
MINFNNKRTRVIKPIRQRVISMNEVRILRNLEMEECRKNFTSVSYEEM